MVPSVEKPSSSACRAQSSMSERLACGMRVLGRPTPRRIELSLSWCVLNEGGATRSEQLVDSLRAGAQALAAVRAHHDRLAPVAVVRLAIDAGARLQDEAAP